MDGRNTCLTCGDVAVPMRVVALRDDGLAHCVADAGESDVEVALLEHVAVGDTVLVHACVALQRVEAAG